MKELYALHADMCKTFSSPARLEILDILRTKEMTVTELTEKTGISQSGISQHLSLMKSKGIVGAKRSKKNIIYSLKDPRIMDAFDIIKEILITRLEKSAAIAIRVNAR